MKWVLVFIGLFLLFSCNKTMEIKRQQLFLKGNIALQENDYPEAVYYFSQSLKVNDTFVDAYNNRAIAYERMGDYQEALNDYEKALRINPNYKAGYFNRAKLWNEIRNYQNALTDLESIAADFQDSASYYFVKGLSHTGLKRYDSAESNFLKAKKLEPGNEELDINLAIVLYHQKKFEKSEQVLSKIIQASELPESYNLMSLLMTKRGNFDLALDYVNKAIQMNSNPFYYNNRGYIYLMKNELEKAYSDISHSLTVDDSNPWAYRNKGIYFFEKGEYKTAENFFFTSLEIDSATEFSSLYLGLVNEKLGNLNDACVHFAKSHELGEQEAIQYLEKFCK